MEKRKRLFIILSVCVVMIPLIVCGIILFYYNKANTPEDRVKEYINLINSKDYEQMYSLLDSDSQKNISKDDFIMRNKNIYSGIEAENISINITNVKKTSKTASVSYETTLDSSAGQISFSNTMNMKREGKKGYAVKWSSSLIFPELGDNDKVRVKTLNARRGDILDRNNVKLATDGNAANIGIVPEKLGENRDSNISKIASILGISTDSINEKLNQSYVKDDMFIPIKVIPEDDSRISELINIPGIMINDSDTRIYPLGEAAAHLTGYVHSITAEELETNKDKGYDENSVIGKTGLEKIFEDKLRGIDGIDIYIVDRDNQKKSVIASKKMKNGEDVKLTIDYNMQNLLYEELKEDKGSSVAMNPDTGEVLALVSTPSYNPNDFILGISEDKWSSLNNDERKPLFNRFQGTAVPGSVFKPIIAVVGVDTGKIKPNESKNINGLSWQKDSSWGDYSVTRVSNVSPVNLRSALVYSDNIYFAQAALDIGKDTLKQELTKLGFGEDIPFEYSLYNSQISTTEGFKNTIQLADSGYGQGEILVNPVQLASVYTLFKNQGNILSPYLIYEENPNSKIWKENVVSKESAEIVKDYMIEIVNNPSGTGHQAKTPGLTIAGKTGTAELKLSQDDTEGTEIGWFIGMTMNNKSNNLLVVAMAEDVKNRGGSHYVVPKVQKALETVLHTN